MHPQNFDEVAELKILDQEIVIANIENCYLKTQLEILLKEEASINERRKFYLDMKKWMLQYIKDLHYELLSEYFKYLNHYKEQNIVIDRYINIFHNLEIIKIQKYVMKIKCDQIYLKNLKNEITKFKTYSLYPGCGLHNDKGNKDSCNKINSRNSVFNVTSCKSNASEIWYKTTENNVKNSPRIPVLQLQPVEKQSENLSDEVINFHKSNGILHDFQNKERKNYGGFIIPISKKHYSRIHSLKLPTIREETFVFRPKIPVIDVKFEVKNKSEVPIQLKDNAHCDKGILRDCTSNLSFEETNSEIYSLPSLIIKEHDVKEECDHMCLNNSISGSGVFIKNCNFVDCTKEISSVIPEFQVKNLYSCSNQLTNSLQVVSSSLNNKSKFPVLKKQVLSKGLEDSIFSCQTQGCVNMNDENQYIMNENSGRRVQTNYNDLFIHNKSLPEPLAVSSIPLKKGKSLSDFPFLNDYCEYIERIHSQRQKTFSTVPRIERKSKLTLRLKPITKLFFQRNKGSEKSVKNNSTIEKLFYRSTSCDETSPSDLAKIGKKTKSFDFQPLDFSNDEFDKTKDVEPLSVIHSNLKNNHERDNNQASITRNLESCSDLNKTEEVNVQLEKKISLDKQKESCSAILKEILTQDCSDENQDNYNCGVFHCCKDVIPHSICFYPKVYNPSKEFSALFIEGQWRQYHSDISL